MVARVLGQIWSSMSVEEKQTYQLTAAAERERVAADMKAWEEDAAASGIAFDSNGENKDNSAALIYPAGRIRKICKLDPEVRGLSKEALLLVTKAAEMFTSLIGKECVRVAQIQNRRKLLPDDVVQVCSSRDRLEFLREDIKDLIRLQQNESTSAGVASSRSKGSSKEPPPNMKPITAFFSSTTTKPPSK